jgi:hypothetical protein
MGGKNSKAQPEGLKFKRKHRGTTISIKFLENAKMPKRPKDDEVKKQLEEILKDIDISPAQLEEIHQLPIKTKWNLVCQHRDYMRQHGDDVKQIAKQQASSSEPTTNEGQLRAESLRDNPTLVQLQNMRRWIQKSEPIQLKSFFIFNGMLYLINVLSVAETCSRNTRNFAKQLEILRIIELLCLSDIGMNELMRIKDSISILMLNFHLNHADLTCHLLEILCRLLWQTEEAFALILEALFKLKEEKGLRSRFELVLQVLAESPNVILIEKTIAFINTFVSSIVDPKNAHLIKSEFVSSGILHSFEVIKHISKFFYE